jgi:hypothetical protein
MIKTVIAYDIVDGVDEQEYNDWIVDVHAHDLLANPYIDRLLFNTVLRPVASSSGGASSITNEILPYRVAEIHYADEDAYAKSLAWFKDHPIPPERGPAGRTKFYFYVVTSEVSIDRENLASVDRTALQSPAGR